MHFEISLIIVFFKFVYVFYNAIKIFASNVYIHTTLN